MDVLAHLKQKAAAQGLIKRVLYYQPFIAEIKGEKKVRVTRNPTATSESKRQRLRMLPRRQMMNMTVYEDSDPVKLAEEAGKLYGDPAGRILRYHDLCLTTMPARRASANAGWSAQGGA